MTIKVLSGSPKERGVLLQQLVKRLLDELGYEDFRGHVAAAGTELEMKAKHRATQAAILCKARCVPREIGPDELKRFLATYAREKKKDRRLVGLYLALSGLSRAARDWYAALENRGKGEFHVFAPEKLLALLRRARLIGPPEVVEPAIKSRIRIDVGQRFLAYHEGHMYWIQLILSGNKPTGYAVLASNGELVSRIVAREIKRLDSMLEGKRLLDLFVRDKVFLAMLDLVPRNLEALTKEVRESAREVREVLQDFDRENLVTVEPGGQPRWKMDRYTLRCDLALFLSLARQYLEGPHRFRFLSSAFASALFAADVPAYLDARWKFRGLDRERAGLFRLLSLSPSALNHALFTSTDRYFTPEADARPLGLLERERPRALQFQRLVGDLLMRMAGDMDHPQFHELLAAKGLKTHLFRASARGASTQELGFDLQAESLIAIGRPAPTGRASAARGESEHFVELGTAMMHMREYEQAVASFDRGIKEIKDPSRLLTAWNHRGICLVQLKKYAEATSCFNEALRYNGNSSLAWLQKAICLKELGDTSGAQRCCRRALDIDPDYVEARDLMQIL